MSIKVHDLKVSCIIKTTYTLKTVVKHSILLLWMYSSNVQVGAVLWVENWIDFPELISSIIIVQQPPKLTSLITLFIYIIYHKLHEFVLFMSKF